MTVPLQLRSQFLGFNQTHIRRVSLIYILLTLTSLPPIVDNFFLEAEFILTSRITAVIEYGDHDVEKQTHELTDLNSRNVSLPP